MLKRKGRRFVLGGRVSQHYPIRSQERKGFLGFKGGEEPKNSQERKI